MTFWVIVCSRSFHIGIGLYLCLTVDPPDLGVTALDGPSPDPTLVLLAAGPG